MASKEEVKEAVESVKNNDISALQQMLWNKRIDVNVRDKPGYFTSVGGHDRTLLHIAALSQHFDIVQFLLKENADVNAVDDYGDTALHCAAKAGDVNIIKALINAKVDVNLAGKFRDTALHCAVRTGNVDVVEVLLAAGADINAPGNDGWTPLHLLSYYGYSELLTMLLDKGAILDTQDKYGDSALHVAARKGHTKIVEHLVKAGADFSIVNNHDETYLEVAVNRAQSGVVHWITKVQKHNTARFSQKMKTKINQLVEEVEEVIMKANKLEADTNISEIMIDARRKGYTIKVRISKILFCGVSGAGKTSFINLLLRNKFEGRYISTNFTKPHQVMAVGKWSIHLDENSSKVELSTLDLDKEIEHFREILRRKKFTSMDYDTSDDEVLAVTEDQDSAAVISPTKPSRLAIEKELSISDSESSKSNPSDIWDVLTLLDTAGQPQFINMLPAINNSVMLTFIVHNLQEELSSNITVKYGYEKAEKSFPSYRLHYSYLDFMKTLISVRKSAVVKVPQQLRDKNIESKNIDENSYLALVGTHSDCVKNEKIAEVNETLNDIIQKGKHKHVWQDSSGNHMFAVDNRTSGDNINEDKNAELIRKKNFKLLQKREIYDVPVTWVLLELEIRKKCQNKSYMYFNNILDMCTECDLNMNEQEIISALQFYHLLGVLLYFKELKNICDIVITDLRWLFDNLTNIVCCTFDDDNTIFADGYLKFKNNGLLTEEFINHIQLQLDNISVAYFIGLLKFLNIIIPMEPDNFCPKSSYFMPCLLPYKQSHPKCLFEHIEPLQIQFKSLNTLPRGAFCFLIVHLLQCKNELDFKLKWTKDKNNPQIFSNLVTFYTNQSYCVTLLDRFFFLEVQIKNEEEEDITYNVNIYFKTKNIIMESLKEVSKQMGLAFSDICFGFQCPNDCEYMAIVNTDFDYIDCSYHRHKLLNRQLVWFKENIQEVTNTAEQIKSDISTDGTTHTATGTKRKLSFYGPAKRTKASLTVLSPNSEKAPSMKWMHKIVIPKICFCWKKIADFLDYPVPKRREINEKSQGDPKKCCTELLEDWLYSDRGIKPKTWSKLILVLKEIDELKDASTEIEEELLNEGLFYKQ